MISNLFPQKLTQGTVFSCARSDVYSGPLYGFIITARCDVAHDKTDTFAYLPVIPVASWARFDGALITARRVAANCVSTLEDILTKSGLAASVFQKIPHREIEAYLSDLEGKDEKRRAEKFKQFSADLLECKETIQQRSDAFLAAILQKHFANFRGVFRDLHSNTIADFHFLPRIIDAPECEGFVINLREVRHLSRSTASKIETGFDASVYRSFEEAEFEVGQQLSFAASSDFSMPISQVRSPEIEQIMQRFTQLFSRIGVEDFNPDDIENVRRSLAINLEISL